MFRSIRWKLSILYFILVFIAIAIVGILMSDRLEDYYLRQIEDNLRSIAGTTVMSLLPEGDLREHRAEIQNNIEKIALPSGFQVHLVDAGDFEIIASSNESISGKNAMELLDAEALLQTLVDQSAEKDAKSHGEGMNLSKIYARFIPTEGTRARYIVYASASLTSAYQSLKATSRIVFNAGSVALAITLITSFLISGSITKPINELNQTANLMAQGDFTQRVAVNANDEIGTLGASFNYLTERLSETLAEISSEKSKLDAIISNMVDALMAVDEHGFVVMYNDALLQMLHLRRIDVYGSNLTQISRELGIGLSLSEIKKHLAQDAQAAFVVEARDKTLKVTAAYYQDENEKLGGYVMLFQDITEAQRLEQMRREFVANVSHELKTPITSIKAYSETLASGMVEDEEMRQSFLQTIEKEADRMASLVGDLLTLSHIDSQKTKLEIQALNLDLLIDDAIAHLRLQFKEKEQQILRTSDRELMILGDSNKMAQVIVNLLSNASKYTQSGGTVEVWTQADESFAYLHIQDNGIGIPAEDVERIFERFYRVDKGRAREMGGTGLGLAIARDTMRIMGGDILARSELEKGSEFVVRIPRASDVK